MSPHLSMPSSAVKKGLYHEQGRIPKHLRPTGIPTPHIKFWMETTYMSQPIDTAKFPKWCNAIPRGSHVSLTDIISHAARWISPSLRGLEGAIPNGRLCFLYQDIFQKFSTYSARPFYCITVRFVGYSMHWRYLQFERSQILDMKCEMNVHPAPTPGLVRAAFVSGNGLMLRLFARDLFLVFRVPLMCAL